MKDNEIVEILRKNKAILIGGMREKIIKYKSIEENTDIFFNSGFENSIVIKKNDKITKRIVVDDINSTKFFLENIGLKKIGTMERYRLKWHYKGNIINLDELPNRNLYRSFKWRKEKRKGYK